MGLLKTASGLILVAGAVGLAITNPGLAAYEAYATKQLSEYISSTVCQELPANLNQVLQNPCSTLVENNQEEIRMLVREQTQRSSFVLFSLYQTRLAIPGLNFAPAYEVKAIGVGQRFFIYQAGEA
ncbi:MAG: DUF4359 domain-containing protein [Cyanobacteria bacterium P01_A01_bin.114]